MIVSPPHKLTNLLLVHALCLGAWGCHHASDDRSTTADVEPPDPAEPTDEANDVAEANDLAETDAARVDACLARVATMRARFRLAAAAQHSAPYEQALASAPVGTVGNVAHDFAPSIVLDASGRITFDGVDVGRPSARAFPALRERWDAKAHQYALLHPDGADGLDQVYVVGEAGASTRGIAQALLGIPPGVAVVFAVRFDTPPAPSPLHPDSPPAVVERIHTLEALTDDAERLRLYGETGSRAIGDCRAFIPVYAASQELDASAKGPFLLENVPNAVEACRCETIDVDMVESLLLLISRPISPPARLLPLDRGRLPQWVTAAPTMNDLARLLEAEFVASGASGR